MSSKIVLLGVLAAVVLVSAPQAFAAEPQAVEGAHSETLLFQDTGARRVGGAIGAAIAVVGAAVGISRIGASACESIARQPEAGGRIFTSMLISAAMIEGAALLCIIVVCLMAVMS